MSEIDFETGEPIWQVEFYHNTPETPGYWTRIVNAESEEKAIEKASALFEADGLPIIRVTVIQTWPLVPLEGGENANG